MGPPGGRAADHVVKTLEERIRRGAFADRDALPPERDLMEEFGTSRTVVREAVRVLSSHGLIDAKPRHRPVVRQVGFEAAIDAAGAVVTHLLHKPRDVKNLFDTRILVEAMLARQAALSADREDIFDLKAALAANAAAVHDSEMFYKTDIQFHSVLYRVSGNEALPAIHRAYTTWLAPQWSKMPRLPERNAQNLAAHTAILDAILLRDPDAAEVALRTHLEDAWAQVRQTFGDL
ncbi:MAG: FadR/GntR family transcriptional regulator [Pseudomonadota bacterium]